jgi:acyl carrier protein
VASDRLHEIVARVLSLEANAVTDATNPHDSPRWDSVGHLNLVLEIEAEFGVRFPADRIPTLDSVGKMRAELLGKGVVFPALEEPEAAAGD